VARTNRPQQRGGACAWAGDRSPWLLGAVLLVGACGGGSIDPPANPASPEPARGALAPTGGVATPLLVSYTPAQLQTLLKGNADGQAVLAAAGAPRCGVAVYRVAYATVGGAGEASRASEALMLPTGGGNCAGSRPIVEFAHGTAGMKSYDIAALNQTTNEAWFESALLAAMFAAQGYIVVAPNYVGYDTPDVATLAYHPYLNRTQQAQEMIDALKAARTALAARPQSGLLDGGELLLSGYSQGGYVALAAHRAMQAAAMRVTAAAPMSGPYALAAFGDAIVFGNVPVGSTIFMPLLTTSYQKTYSNLYTATSVYYESAYATGIESLLPNAQPYAALYQANLLPPTALFSSTAPPSTGNAALDAVLAVPTTTFGSTGFGKGDLVTNTLRVSYGTDALANPDGAFPNTLPGAPQAGAPSHPLRIALKNNDLRDWTPSGTAPLQLCGGHNDPTVFYATNTGTMAAYWSAGVAAGGIKVLDVDPDGAAPLLLTGGYFSTIENTADAAFLADLHKGVTNTVQIASDVRAAIVALYPAGFTSTAGGPVPSSPAGYFVQAMTQYIGAIAATDAGIVLSGKTDTFKTDVGAFLVANYHVPLAELACTRATRDFFAAALQSAARHRHTAAGLP